MAYTTIDDPSAHFQTVIWTGNDSNPRTISHDGNSDMQPDWVWHKIRSGIASHMTYDSTRGTTKRLHIDQGVAEAVESAAGTLTAFTSDGFTVNAGTSNDNYVNDSSLTYVSWGWKANGGTTASNTDGDRTSTVQANTDAGFSIVTWASTGGNESVGHGLGVAPAWFITKNISASSHWKVYHHKNTSAPQTDNVSLNNTDQTQDDAAAWNDTAPTSTTFTVGTDAGSGGSNTNNMVAYCFAEKQGYSKFGSYTGNANADGAFVYTGFKPAWLMVKRTDSAQNWIMYDSKRNDDAPAGANVIDRLIYANDTDAEVDTGGALMVDFLSNGFKMRGTHASSNGAGVHIYMAFAENPFVSSKGVPTTAR